MSRKTRQRRVQAQAAPAPDDDDFEVLDAPEPEIDDALPPEDEAPLGKSTLEEDPYAILQREFDAVSRQREEAEERAREEASRRQAAERQRDELGGRVSQHAVSELESHKALVQKEYTLAENEGQALEATYAQAMAEGDYTAAAKAQRAMVRIEGKLKQLEEIYIAVEDRIKNPPKAETRQARQVDEFEEGLRQLPKPIQDWAREHEDDLRKRTDVALAAGNLAVRKGLQPGSDAYLDFMDEQMGYFADDGAEPEPEPEPEPRRAPATRQAQAAPARRRAPPSAPVTRGSGSDTSKVYLTEYDKREARELGYTEREYAKFVRDAKDSPIAKKFGMQVAQRSGGR